MVLNCSQHATLLVTLCYSGYSVPDLKQQKCILKFNLIFYKAVIKIHTIYEVNRIVYIRNKSTYFYITMHNQFIINIRYHSKFFVILIISGIMLYICQKNKKITENPTDWIFLIKRDWYNFVCLGPFEYIVNT